ncbi:MAG: thiol reductant ABC exporter subunit CydC [Wenzhouxiangellaceae bacterium]|nr:thiol reductant ABC exporter subunit CydC [Wenzhouxiangellaceae bacterium]
MSVLRRILLPGRRTLPALALAVTAGALATLAAVVLLALSGWLITATALAGLGALAMLDLFAPGAGIRAAAVTRTVARYLERLVGHDATFRQLAELRVEAARGLLNRSVAELERLRVGESFSRLTRDIDQLDHLLPRLLLPALSAVIPTVLVIGVLVVVFDGTLATVLAGFLLLAAGLLALGARASRRPGGAVSIEATDMRSGLVEWLAGLAELVSLNRADEQAGSVLASGRRRLAAQRRLGRIEALMHGGLLVAGYLAFWLVLWIGIGLYEREALTGPWMIGLALAVLALIEAWLPLAVGVSFFETARRSAGRVDGLIDADRPTETPVAGQRPNDLHLAVRDLHFRFALHQPELFDGLDLDLVPGEKRLVRGPSGCGKSTLGRLLGGILEPDSGRITLGGVALDQLDPRELRRTIGWMPQDVTLFHDSLGENLRLAAPDADDGRMIDVLERLQLGAWLRGLPDGIDTWLGEHGKTVSGGQARRLSLARMVLADYPLLILDEPTRGLDLATATAMWDALADWLADRSIIFLSHDTGHLPAIDRVIDLDALARQGSRAR